MSALRTSLLTPAQHSATDGSAMVVDDKPSIAARPGPSSSSPGVLQPGDALTVWRGGASHRGTLLRISPMHMDVIWSEGDFEGTRSAVTNGETWLPGWHASDDFEQAKGSPAPITTRVEDLMLGCRISTEPTLTVNFCSLSSPGGEGTCAAFDLSPESDCPVGSFVPVGVRLHELGGDALLLAVYLPDPLYVHLETPATTIEDYGGLEVALGLNDGAAGLYIHFGNSALKEAFMGCVGRVEPTDAKRRRE